MSALQRFRSTTFKLLSHGFSDIPVIRLTLQCLFKAYLRRRLPAPEALQGLSPELLRSHYLN